MRRTFKRWRRALVGVFHHWTHLAFVIFLALFNGVNWALSWFERADITDFMGVSIWVVSVWAVLLWLIGAFFVRFVHLEREKEPRLECNDITIWNNDGEFFVRVQLKNKSPIMELVGAIPYLRMIVADDPLQEIERIDFPIQIYSQRRLRDRFAARDPLANPAEPINFGPDQKKWLELFQVTEAVVRTIHLVEHDGRRDIISIPNMRFAYTISKAPSEISFTVIYEEVANDWRVILENEQGELIGPVKPERRDE